MTVQNPTISAKAIQLTPELYYMYIQVKSRKGYQGWLSSLELDGEKKSLLEPGVSRVPPQFSDAIRRGCSDPTNSRAILQNMQARFATLGGQQA